MFPCFDNLEMCGLQDIVSALEADDTRLATHSCVSHNQYGLFSDQTIRYITLLADHSS